MAPRFGPPRLHYTIATGKLTTKLGGGEYALERFPSRWHRLVSDALAVRRHETTSFTGHDDPETAKREVADFIEFVIADAHGLAQR